MRAGGGWRLSARDGGATGTGAEQLRQPKGHSCAGDGRLACSRKGAIHLAPVRVIASGPFSCRMRRKTPNAGNGGSVTVDTRIALVQGHMKQCVSKYIHRAM